MKGLLMADAFSDGLPIGDLGLADLGFHLEIVDYSRNEHIEMKLTHARDYQLSGILVFFDGEGGILSSQDFQGLSEFFTFRECSRLDGHRNHGLRKVYLFKKNGVFVSPDRISSLTKLESHYDGYISGTDFIYMSCLV